MRGRTSALFFAAGIGLYGAMRVPYRALWERGWGLAAHSLSGRLLLLTILYVLASEVLIFVPAIGLYHRELLDDHILSAELAILPFTEPGGQDLSRGPAGTNCSSTPMPTRCCSSAPISASCSWSTPCPRMSTAPSI